VFYDPDSFPAKAYAGPDPSLGGQIVAQVLWADGVDPQDPAIAERTGLLANLSETMVSMCKATGTDNIYIGTGEAHPALHTEAYDFPDEILPVAAAMFRALI
jgi:hypothetical protein